MHVCRWHHSRVGIHQQPNFHPAHAGRGQNHRDPYRPQRSHWCGGVRPRQRAVLHRGFRWHHLQVGPERSQGPRADRPSRQQRSGVPGPQGCDLRRDDTEGFAIADHGLGRHGVLLEERKAESGQAGTERAARGRFDRNRPHRRAHRQWRHPPQGRKAILVGHSSPRLHGKLHRGIQRRRHHLHRWRRLQNLCLFLGTQAKARHRGRAPQAGALARTVQRWYPARRRGHPRCLRLPDKGLLDARWNRQVLLPPAKDFCPGLVAGRQGGRFRGRGRFHLFVERRQEEARALWIHSPRWCGSAVVYKERHVRRETGVCGKRFVRSDVGRQGRHQEKVWLDSFIQCLTVHVPTFEPQQLDLKPSSTSVRH
mmetsp:Transcript_25114/g.69272  ORF Transcript_25114/g.69272 Transcript_25114/m.69272 type:complete len:367 (-) Transcript_25114:1348-2448(-)